MMMLPGKTQPLITIITPTFNAGATLAETLRSVQGQLDERTEHLLVDASSSDGTLEIARKADWLKVSSDPDRGIYDGMNKGAASASGEWLLFLQADDWLPEGTLEAYRSAITDYPDAEVICGSAEALKEVNGTWQPVWSVNAWESKELTFENVALGEPMINARLIRRETFMRLGGFSLDYSLASDRDFLLRAAKERLSQADVRAVTYRYRWHAGSSTMTEGNALTDRLLDENIRIAEHHLKRLSEAEKEPLRRWHTRLCVQGAMNALESGKPGILWEHMAAGVSRDPLWPAVFFREICRSLPGFVGRGFRSRSMVLQKGRSHDREK
jgi:glycosyltransferase involved in cell wall biosynthesis